MTSKNSINVIKNTQDKFIEGDEDQLNRVMINLIKNSEEAQSRAIITSSLIL